MHSEMDLDDESAPFVDGFERALSDGSIKPMVKSFGMSGIADLLRAVPLARRGDTVRMLFSTDANQVRSAVRIIVDANGADEV